MCSRQWKSQNSKIVLLICLISLRTHLRVQVLAVLWCETCPLQRRLVHFPWTQPSHTLFSLFLGSSSGKPFSNYFQNILFRLINPIYPICVCQSILSSPLQFSKATRPATSLLWVSATFRPLALIRYVLSHLLTFQISSSVSTYC